MKNKYKITGMTCESCEMTVKSSLLSVQGVQTAEVSRADNSANITSDTHMDLETLQNTLGKKYTISEMEIPTNPTMNTLADKKQSWFDTYRPVLLIFFYLSLTTLLIQYTQGTFHFMQWMNHFMAGFFLVFSFFKFLNLRGFADSYRMYDIVARKFPMWGYIYAFIELGLGVAYLMGFAPIIMNTIMIIIMSISIVGVLQSVLNKKKIRCACLGDVFNLPMSTITIIEDGLMIIMGIVMLILMSV